MAEIFLIGCYPEADIAAFAAAAGQNLGLPVRYLREFKPLGTAGGLYFFRDLVRAHLHSTMQKNHVIH